MILGFNHNINYKNEVFHVQTEDSGVTAPNITTLLYKGGVILCSKRTSYADIIGIDSLEEVVEELMKEQHKEMMRRLKSGEFDARAFSLPASNFENIRLESPADAADENTAFSAAEFAAALKGAMSKVCPAGVNSMQSLDDAVAALLAG